jgi:hypothetical protein
VYGHRRRLLEALDEVGRDGQDEIDAARGELGEAGVRLRERAVHERLRLALHAPVILVALEDDLMLDLR